MLLPHNLFVNNFQQLAKTSVAKSLRLDNIYQLVLPDQLVTSQSLH